jgi:peptide/nickel transport system permease protein
MPRFVLMRILRIIPVLVLATFLPVALLSLAPGSLAVVILGPEASPEAVAQFRADLGLDDPVWTRYFHWLIDALGGDLGTSPLTHQSVIESIWERLPVTLEIALLAQVIAIGIAVVLAVAAANRPDGLVDKVVTAFASVAMSVPAFIAGPILVYFFAIQLGMFPVSGWKDLADGLGPNLQSALLPAISVGLMEIAAYLRMLRADLGTTLDEDFIDSARARGLGRWYILWRHAFRPSSFSLLTLSAISFGRLLGGTVIVEYLFGLPGLGQLIFQSITARDVLVVQGVVCFVVVVFVVLNTLVDLCYGILDPRVRQQEGAR